MENTTRFDFLFAFQTQLLAEVARKPGHWHRGAIDDLITTALEASFSLPDQLTVQEIVDNASRIIP
jgi:hypothetical protein